VYIIILYVSSGFAGQICRRKTKELKTLKATKKSQAEVLPTPSASRRPEWLRKLDDGKYLLLLVIPALINIIFFHYVPMFGIVVAFQDFDPFLGFLESEWVGFRHFIRFFNYTYCWRLFKNTFLLSFYGLIFAWPTPIILALILNETKNEKWKKFVQTVSYMPHFFSTVVIVGLVTMLLSPTGGLVANALEAIGVDASNILAEAKYFRTIYILSDIWAGTGWGAIIYLAALTNVDPQLYEAAVVDGAGKLRCLWNITLPSIAPTIITMLLLRLGSIMSLNLERALLLQTPSTYETSEIIATYVYQQGIIFSSFSYSSAVGLFNSLVSLVLVIVSNYVSKTVSETSLW
jgi:putative aldouronate transport system permease protein